MASGVTTVGALMRAQRVAARLRPGRHGLRTPSKDSARACRSPNVCAASRSDLVPCGWESVELRAFVHPSTSGGGNPVTAFVVPTSEPFPSTETRAALAATCDWESAFVQSARAEGEAGRMNFHVPSGPAMDMCAHAALGGAAVLVDARQPPTPNSRGQRASGLTQEFLFRTCDGGGIQRSQVSSDGTSAWRASLQLDASSYLQSDIFSKSSPDRIGSIPDESSLDSMLHQLGLDSSDLAQEDQHLPVLNAGVMGRSKTLVPLRSAERVNAASAPSDPHCFSAWCDAAGGSTGVYLYAPASQGLGDSEFECRQFPRSSGYPEDPATGVAAMALAMALQGAGHASSDRTYGFNQGRAMGMLSWIEVAVQQDMVVCRGLVRRI